MAYVSAAEFGAVPVGPECPPETVRRNTLAINSAIQAAARAGGMAVLPAGRYETGTIHLQSNATLHLASGARLVGTKDLSAYTGYTLPGSKMGRDWHHALIYAHEASNIAITGPGVIDGNKVFNPRGEEAMRGPHTILTAHCSRLRIENLAVIDSANYAVFTEDTTDIDIRDCRFIGGWDGIHIRGRPERLSRNIHITHCDFQTGDDAIAGRYWQDTVISHCQVNSACNGIRLIGPASSLIVHSCLFYGPGRQPHITQGRHNSLAAILLQPGSWDETHGTLDDVLISDITTHRVATPLNLYTKPGNTAGQITIERLSATGTTESGICLESWAETPIREVTLRDVHVDFAPTARAESADTDVSRPKLGTRRLPAWGLYARRVETLRLRGVHFAIPQGDPRPVMVTHDVGRVIRPEGEAGLTEQSL